MLFLVNYHVVKKFKKKKTDFYHKKDCKGNLYLAEYNQKMIIVCSKCKAVNQYSKFIWTCPECGLHFRDKKSEINEIKIRKTKSSNRVNILKGNFQEIDNDNYSTINNLFSSRKRSSLFDILKKKKKENDNKENKESFRFSTGFDFYKIKNKNKLNDDSETILSERKMENKEYHNILDSDNNEFKISNKKIKRGYLLGKILR